MKKLYVQEIINYVEDNIYEPLNVDIIATHIGYSRHYIHRLFSIYTGMYLMDYVRKRKLEYSLMDLQTEETILNIAVKYGFNSSRTYARAFQTTYGVSPGKYRHNSYELSPKLILNHIGGINMLPYLSEPKIVTADQIHAVGHRVFSKECEGDVITYMTNYQLKHNLVKFTELGFDVPVSDEDSAKGLRGYEQWVVLPEDSYNAHTPEEPVYKITVPKSKYLMLTITEPFIDPWDRIPNGWKKLWAAVEEHHTFKENFIICGFEEKIDTLAGTYMNLYIPIN